MAVDLAKEKRTIIVAVEKDTYYNYTIKVTRPIWNSMQIALIKGFEAEGVNVEIEYKLQEGGKVRI